MNQTVATLFAKVTYFLNLDNCCRFATLSAKQVHIWVPFLKQGGHFEKLENLRLFYFSIKKCWYFFSAPGPPPPRIFLLYFLSGLCTIGLVETHTATYIAECSGPQTLPRREPEDKVSMFL